MNFKMLLVDDDEIFIMMSKFMIKESNFHPNPLSFMDGEEAYEYLKDSYNPNENYVIFLDINMPRMNGWEFLESINEFASPSNTLIFMVSSSTDYGDISRAGENIYIKKFLSKPYLTETLIELKNSPELKAIF